MIEKEDNQGLDELFRSTFDALPDTPSSNGWDLPSNKVWEHVHQQIQPKAGWSAMQVISTLAVLIVVGAAIYFGARQNEGSKPATPETTPQIEVAQQPVEAQVQEQDRQPSSEDLVETTNQETNTVRNSTQANSTSSNQLVAIPTIDEPVQEEKVKRPQEPPMALPLPGSKQDDADAHNTQERLIKEIWSKPVEPLPTILEIRNAQKD
jgi:hypothetical protein